MAGQTTIEKKGYDDRRAKSVLLEALRGRGGMLTRADAVAASGLPEDETTRGLTLLLKEYRSHLSATESGELLYQFDPSFERRDAVSLRERLATAGRTLWRGFTFLFKVGIVVTLVVYFLVFLAIMIGLILGRRGDSDSDDGGGIGFGPILWFWGWGPSPHAGYHGYGRRPVAPKPQRPFYKRVFDFVFGPPRPKVDPLADEREILAYIRQKSGRIAAVDLVALMGWDFPRAEEEATRLLADYGGEPEVTEDGVVLYVFKDLRKTAESGVSQAEKAPRWAWQRMESTPPLTGNGAGTNAGVIFLNGFNLVAAFSLLPMLQAQTVIPLDQWQFLLRDFPLAFSSLFFAIPLGRAVHAKLQARGRAERNRKRLLLSGIMAGEGAPRPLEELAPDPALAKVLERSLIPLGGDVEPDAEGRVRYGFPRIREERAAVERARRQASAGERDAGRIVFSSDN
jgi:hypothetical protein